MKLTFIFLSLVFKLSALDPILEKSAKSGDIAAQYRIGVNLIWEGEKVEKGIYWLQKSSSSGHAQAMHMLGIIFLKGYEPHVTKDTIKGIKLLEKAARMKNFLSTQILSDIYIEGKIVDQNYNEALKWLKLLVKNHKSKFAAYDIAMLYLKGNGVKKDRETAIKWLELSAKLKSKDADKMLTQIRNENNVR